MITNAIDGTTTLGTTRRRSYGLLLALTLGGAGALPACLPAEDEGGASSTGGANGVDGGAGAPNDVPSRTRLGSVTLSAAWRNGNSGTLGYVSSDEQVVECVWDRQSSLPALSLAAGDSGKLAAASVWIEDVYVPASGSITFSASTDYALEAIFRFSGQEDLLFEYAYSTAGTVATTCSLETRTFDSTTLSGHLACRDVIATPASADYTTLTTPVTTSVTVAFDCPLNVLEPKPTTSTGGQPGSGGQPGTGGGTGSGGGQCVGSATPCSLLASTTCAQTLGCYTDGDCSGVSKSCYSIYTSYACTSQDGCYWSSLNSDCSGVSRSCGGYSIRSTCTSQDGCNWRDTCSGSSWSCASFYSPLDCVLQRGCSWITD